MTERPGDGSSRHMPQSGDVPPDHPSPDLANSGRAHSVHDSCLPLRERATPDLADQLLGELGVGMLFPAQKLIRMNTRPVAISSSRPALDCHVSTVIGWRTFPQVSAPQPNNTVDLVVSNLVIPAACRGITSVQRLHTWHERSSQGFLQRELMGAGHGSGAVLHTADLESPVSIRIGVSRPEPASIWRGEAINIAAMTLGIGRKLMSGHRKLQTFGVARRGVSSASPCHFTCWGWSQ